MKKVLFYFFSYLVLAVAVLIVTECALWLMKGSAYRDLLKDDSLYYELEIHEPYFKKKRTDSGDIICETQRSHASFERFRLRKGPRVKRIFITGESVAHFFGGSKERLAELLKIQAPQYEFEIINCGTSGYDSYRVMLIIKELVKYQPDLIIVFVGNNEFLGVPKVDQLLFNPLGRYIYKKFWLGHFLHRLFLKKIAPLSDSPSGMKVVFKNNIEEIISIMQKKKIPLALSTLPVNFRDFPPFSSDLYPLTDKNYFRARLEMEKGNYSKAVAIFNSMIVGEKAYDDNPYFHFYLAQALQSLGDYPLAQAHYLQALNRDVFPGYRCTPDRNEIIRQCALNKGVIFLDLEKKFIEMAPHGLVGDELFQDHCHWWDAFNELISKEIIKTICAYNKKNTQNILGLLEKADVQIMIIDINKITQDTQAERKVSIHNLWLWGIARVIPEYAKDKICAPSFYSFKKVYLYDPELLKNTMNSEHAVIERFQKNIWTENLKNQVEQNWFAVLWHVGEAYRQLKEYSSALQCFNKSLELRGNQVYPYVFRGLTFYMLNDFTMAQADWSKAKALDPQLNWLNDLLPAK